jgi:cytochrome oxidase assembly protein ShyY1
VNHAEYVITGWVLTAVVIAAYWMWVVRRTRRAEASWRAEEGDAG